ncbi:MAG: MarR family transcriptional regulator [Candidatus Omnitrophica bacterium]|nr:MarR family transcriptional regulator [Candidatus Omnitrophota bacterium]
MDIREKFIETIGNLGESIGLNRTVCQIYALLYINPEPLSPAEIGRTLGVSKGNISINIKKLEEWNAVKKVWKKGYTRSFYTANADIEGIIFEKLKTGLTKRNRLLIETIIEMKKSIKTTDKKVKKYYSTRLLQIESLLKQSELFTKNIDILRSFLKKK